MTNTKTDGERLVRLETKVENIDKMVLGMDGKLDNILKEQNNVRLQNVTRTELESELKRIESAIESTKKRHGLTLWIGSALASVFSIVLTLLVTYFINNIGK